jgi:adenylate cyclase
VPGRESIELSALNADVVGYSRLMADDRDATSQAMAAARDAVDTAVRRRDGRPVDFVGDNFLAVFDAPMDAVRAAIEVAEAMEKANAGLPAARWLRFRMGIDAGDALVVNDRYEGDVLNVAARLQAIAPAGGLAVSGSVFRALDEPELRFRPMGSRHLKNIPEPVEVYEFVGLPTLGRTSAAMNPGLELPSVAVLPLHAESVGPDLAAAASVVRDDLLHRLTVIPELRVVDASTPPIGARTRYILECGVYQVGEQVRVHATLSDITTMNVVKAHKETGAVSELLELSEVLAERMGRTVEVELVVGEPAGVYAELGDPESIQKVYQGWYHLRSYTAQGWTRACALFEEVATAHPELATGWALGAFANWLGATSGWAPNPDKTLALAARQAEQGMRIGDPTGMSQVVRAAILLSRGHIEEASEAVAGLEITRPTCDVTFGIQGSIKRYFGDWEEAVGLMDTAMRLTPVIKPWYPTVKSCSLLIGTRAEQAAATAEAVLEYQPANLEAMLVLAAAQVELGLNRRARATADGIRERFPGTDIADWLHRQPYQEPRLVSRWKSDLATLGLVRNV